MSGSERLVAPGQSLLWWLAGQLRLVAHFAMHDAVVGAAALAAVARWPRWVGAVSVDCARRLNAGAVKGELVRVAVVANPGAFSVGFAAADVLPQQTDRSGVNAGGVRLCLWLAALRLAHALGVHSVVAH